VTFFQIDRGVFTSSLWLAGTTEEKLLWVWLLGNADDVGVVRHRELAIAFSSGLPRDVVDAALRKFSEPDPESRTRDNDGRRIARTGDGFVRILNHELYYSKDYSTPRWRRWKERKGLKGSENVGQQLATLENVGSTKDKDKDKDNNNNVPPPTPCGGGQSEVSGNEQPPARPTKRTKKGGDMRPERDWSAEVAKFNRAFQVTFGRRASLPPDKGRVFGARLEAGFPIEFLVALPVAAAAAGLAKGRDIEPEYLLRDGSRSYTRNGEVRQGFDWLGTIWQAMDRLRLTSSQAELLRELGALEWWEGRGVKVVEAAEAKTW
jgi:hypothetical protein